MKKTENKKPVELVSFYGGQVVVEKKPWGDHHRFTINGRSGILSPTGVVKYLDKSNALLPWAVGLVGSHITSSFEAREGDSFTKEEIYMVVNEAVRKPEEAKIAGGKTGDMIHEFAHEFAKADIAELPYPKIPKIAKDNPERDKILKGINAFLKFYNQHSVQFLKMEQVVYYNSFFAGDSKEGEEIIEVLGIIDLIAKVDGVVGVWDYKTGKKVYTDQRYQLSSYRKAWNSNPDNDEMFCAESGILHFSKETGDLLLFRLSNEESEKDWGAFLGLHRVAVREKELEAEHKDKLKNESK